LIAYLLSDSIHSGCINGELEKLRRNRAAKSALESRLRFGLQQPTWPRDPVARIAIAIWLLDHPAVPVGRWMHPHEPRRQHRLRTALGLKGGF
jgi:hypothetical protein